MRPKNLTLVIVFVALIGIGIWWVMQPKEVVSVKAAQAPVPTKTVAPPMAQVEMPKLAAVAPPSNPPVAAHSEIAPDADASLPFKAPLDVMELGTIKFTEGVPASYWLNDGTRCTLTAHAIDISDMPRVDNPVNEAGMTEFDVAFEHSDTGKTTTIKITAMNGKPLSVADGKTILKFSFEMKTD
jgi:cytoskeletal protein RodZ